MGKGNGRVNTPTLLSQILVELPAVAAEVQSVSLELLEVRTKR